MPDNPESIANVTGPTVLQTTGSPQPATSNPHDERSPWHLGGLTLGQLAKRVVAGINDDDVFGRSAQLAYYFFAALFPALFFVTAVFAAMAGPGTQLHDSLMGYLSQAMPPDAYSLVLKVLSHTHSSGGKIAFGILGALWPATSGMAAVVDTLNAVHEVREERPLWKVYGMALFMALSCGILVVLALAVILYGNAAANFVGNHVGLSAVFTWLWKIVQWPIALFFLILNFSIIYYFAPNVEQRHWQWLTPGAVIGIFAWLVASFGFREYLHFFNSYSATYGAIGAVIILLTWFYITGFMLLVGAEINVEIEHAAAKRGAPDAKQKGQKRPQGEPQRRTA